ncbi:MAG: hypothetical protein EA378_06770 [Phycisphaerales bacterium]|nr:MAG: hypothetical protein EA378_06770 [Phycisphaerales bacterium]
MRLWLLLFMIVWVAAPVVGHANWFWMVLAAFGGFSWGVGFIGVVLGAMLIVGALAGLIATRRRVDRVVRATSFRSDLLILVGTTCVVVGGPVLGHFAPTNSFIFFGWAAAACGCGTVILARLGQRLAVEAAGLHDTELAGRCTRLRNTVLVLVAGVILTLMLGGIVAIMGLAQGEIMGVIHSVVIAVTLMLGGIFALIAVWFWVEVITCVGELRRKIQRRFAPETTAA